MLIDTHSHLFWDSYKEDFDQVTERAIKAGVGIAVNVGVDVSTSQKAADLVSRDLNIKFYSSIGIHPHEAYKYSIKGQASRVKLEEDISALEKVYRSNPGKVIAVGECGLDSLFNPNYAPNGETLSELMDLQKKLFKGQIDLAIKLNLPILIHCRDDRGRDLQSSECWDEVLKLTQNHFGILHCYSGLMPTTKKALETKFLFSFAGNLTYPKNNYLVEAVKIIPLERIVLETDCPFLPPQSIRGQRNEPSSVREIAEFISEIKQVSFEDIAKQTTENFKRLINLQP